MPAYRDEKTKTWYCKFHYVTWDGKRKQTTKRGFATKREAVLYENEIKGKAAANMNITLKTFVEMYFEDKQSVLKERSITNKRYMIERHIIPLLGDKRMDEIRPADIIAWQNEMLKLGFSETYLRMVQNQVTALFTHASTIYGLSPNPCRMVKKIGKSEADELNFWTEDEYEQFLSTIDKDKDPMYYVLFEILFWCGLRVGEVLALTPNDIDSKTISISKTYYRTKGKDVITEPKTENSVRIIDIPEFLADEISMYEKRLYKYPKDQRLFPVVAEAVQHKMKRHIEKAGVKKIRVHDLRHSHVAYLIHQGVDPLLIKQRLGHKDIQITLNTYGHLYPNEGRKLADILDRLKKQKQTETAE